MRKSSKARAALSLAGFSIVFLAVLGTIIYINMTLDSIEAQAQSRPLSTPAVNTDLNCDNALKDLISRTPGPYGAPGVTALVLAVQAQSEGCNPGTWDPIAINATDYNMCGSTPLESENAIGTVSPPPTLITTIPSMFYITGPGAIAIARRPKELGLTPKTTVTPAGDAVVHWDQGYKPSDGANCWLRHSTQHRWSSE